MSQMQLAIWFDEQLSPGTLKNHISAALAITSEFGIGRFERAVRDVISLNPLLRARFIEVEGGPRQWVSPDALGAVEVVDATAFGPQDIRDRLREHHCAPFDLAQGPPIRFLLLDQGDGNFVFSIAAHHLVADLWSLLLIWEEIRRFHEDGEVDGRRTIEYGDFVGSENDVMSDGAPALEHYRQRFETWSDQPAEWSRRSDSGTGLASIRTIELTADEVAGVKAAAREMGVSLRSLVLAAFQTVLHREARLENVVVGELKANRSSRSAAIVGCCVNVVPRFADFTDQLTLRGVVETAERSDRDARAFDRYPFRALLRRLRPDHGVEPFFVATFAWQRSVRVFDEATTAALAFGVDGDPVEVGSFRVSPVAMPARSATNPLTLLAGGGSADFRLAFEYQEGAITADTVERLGRELRSVLRAVVSEPDACVADLDLRSDEERAFHEAEWHSTIRSFDENVTTLDLIQAQIAERAASVAVSDSMVAITYGELGQRSDRLALRLRRAGVTPGDLVGIVLDRTVDMVVAIVGAWKCGAGYVPMDPGFPSRATRDHGRRRRSGHGDRVFRCDRRVRSGRRRGTSRAVLGAVRHRHHRQRRRRG